MNYRPDFIAQVDLSRDERELTNELLQALRTVINRSDDPRSSRFRKRRRWA